MQETDSGSTTTNSELFVALNNVQKPLINFTKRSISDVVRGLFVPIYMWALYT